MTHTTLSAKTVAAVALCVVLSACQTLLVTRAPQSPSEPAISPVIPPAKVDPIEGACFASATIPAVVETVTEQVMVQPTSVDSDSTAEPQTAFHTATRQEILRDRREVEFETPCDDIQTPQFLASVQRALLARGYYDGPITGQVNPALTSAIRQFQIDRGDVHTGQLTIQTARTLGLVAVPRDAS